ncbi:helix-turn-helix domain-containing protein [Phaeocystidibacter luteus]|uniref:Transcription regulator BetR N-terminal domain-containing protein n=1 Tax=Phaeocystidibacter luteus TaxID=911197 RepID=A0A6N6RKR0_9FLAO|nr:helix-turn-helix domain-containing protein [Phaeocystidibacter luteus]KAB2813750.1 hypothetical protein F8C67_06215 [Phaeocystidibacter luteus]
MEFSDSENLFTRILFTRKRNMTATEFHSKFVRLLERQLPAHTKPADQISSDLGISTASAYRKLSGKSPFSTEELTTLCERYLISLDEAMYSDPSQVVIFKKTQEVVSLETMELYFHTTLAQLETLRNIPEATLYYAARDLPLFFYFRFPSLGAFKILVWLKDAGSDLMERNEVFDFNKVPKELLELGYKLNQTYYDMPTSEIWTPRTMANVFEQIQYYYRSGLLHKEDAKHVLEDVRKLIDERETRARENEKKEKIKAELYSCDFLMMANGAMAKLGPNRMAWVAFNGINFVNTTNPNFCEDYEKAFRQHANLGVLISGSAEKQRSEFFRKLRDQIGAMEKLLAMDLDFA